MRVKKETGPRQLLCLTLAVWLMVALLPLNVFADWDNAGKPSVDMIIAGLLENAKQKLEGAGVLDFTFTSYAPPTGTDMMDWVLSPEPGETTYPVKPPKGALSVMVSREAGAEPQKEDNSGDTPADPVPIVVEDLPIGTYTVQYKAATEGQSVKEPSIADGESLAIIEDGTAALSYTLTSKEPEANLLPDLNQYVTNMLLTVDGNEPVDIMADDFDPDTLNVEAGSKVEVKGIFSIEEAWDSGFRSGVDYNIQLPTGLDFVNTISAASDGLAFTLDTANKTASLRILLSDEDLEHVYFSIDGAFSYSGTVTEQAGGTAEDLLFTIGSKVIRIPILQPVEEADVQKTGKIVPDTGDALVEWTIQITAPDGIFPKGLVISDVMTYRDKSNTEDPFHELRKIQSVTIDGNELAEENYTITRTTQGFHMALQAEQTGDTLTIVFTSNLSEAGLKRMFSAETSSGSSYARGVRNEVTVREASESEGQEGREWGTKDHTVTGTQVRLLKKKFVRSEADSGNVTDAVQVWRLFVNQSFMNLPAGTEIVEKLPQGLSYQNATLHTWASGDPDDFVNYQEGRLEDYFDVFVDAEAGQVTFTLKKDGMVNEPLVIEVKTKRSGNIGSYDVKNNAELRLYGKTFTADASTGSQPGSYVYKEGANQYYEYSTHAAVWHVYFGNTTEGATLSDTMVQGDGTYAQELIAASAELQERVEKAAKPNSPYGFSVIRLTRTNFDTIQDVKNGTANSEKKSVKIQEVNLAKGENTATDGDVTFTFHYNKDTHTLSVTADKALDGVYQITYFTYVSNDILYGTQQREDIKGAYGWREILNTATLEVSGSKYTVEAKKNQQNANFNKVSNGYDAATGRISWTIQANRVGLQYQQDSFQIIDKLPEGLEPARDENGDYIIALTSGKNRANGVKDNNTALSELQYTWEAEFDEETRELIISVLASEGNTDPYFALPVNAKITTCITDGGMKKVLASGSKGYAFLNWGYQCGKDMEGTDRWDGGSAKEKITAIPLKKSSVYNQETTSIDWSVQINPQHQAIINPNEPLKLRDTMSVTGNLGSIKPNELATLDSKSVKLVRTTADGESFSMPMENRAGAESYYTYDAETMTLEVYIAPSQDSATDQYTLTYSTQLNLPDDYTEKGSATFGNEVQWAGSSSTTAKIKLNLNDVSTSLKTQKYSAITVYKQGLADQTPLGGATFELYRINGGSRTWVGTLTTDDTAGSAVFERLKKGDYVLVETSAPKGYAMTSKETPVTIENQGDTPSVTVTNTRIENQIVITKVDAANKEHTLSGAEFTLYVKAEDGTETQYGEPAATDENGIATFSDLSAGSYLVYESKAPEGYFPLEKPIAVTIDAESTKQTVALPIANTAIKNAILINKVDALDETIRLAGAEFTLYVKAEDGSETQYGEPVATDEHGIAIFPNLPKGDYVVRETKVPAGYQTDGTAWQQEVSITGLNDAKELTCKNTPILGKVILLKIGEKGEDGSGAALPGAKFELLGADGKTVVTPEQTTNELGQITFDNLRPGTYYLRETAAPSGYDLSTELREVVITLEKASVSVMLENHKTETPIDPVDPDRPTPPPDENIPDNNTPGGDGDNDRNDREDREDRSVRVVDPVDLTPEEVEALIDDGFVPLDDRPNLTPEQIIEEDIPLILIPDEDVPLVAMPGIPQTGDRTPVTLLALVLLASVTGLAVLNRKPRVKK